MKVDHSHEPRGSSDAGARCDSAKLMHERSASHHERAGERWRARGDLEWAELERRAAKATIEREIATTQRDAIRQPAGEDQSGYSSLRKMLISPRGSLGVRLSRNEANGATNGSGADTV